MSKKALLMSTTTCFPGDRRKMSESELLLVTRPLTFIHQDLRNGKLVPSSCQRSKLSYFILCTYSGWDYRMWKGIPISNGLREEGSLVNISFSSGDLKCQRVMISAAPNWGNKVVCWNVGSTFKSISLLSPLLFLRDSHLKFFSIPVILPVSKQ